MNGSLKPWIDSNRLPAGQRWPGALALLCLVVYIAAVVLGATLQAALGLPWKMGWMQQIAGALAAVALAFFIGAPAALLGWQAPSRGWLWRSIGAGLSISLVGVAVSRFLPPDPTTPGLEYVLYQATMPGIGEEFGLRGPWLALLVVAASRLSRLPWPRFTVLVLAALPFALLHLLDRSGMELLLIGAFTLYAGIVLGWVRLAYASVWPAVLAHNVANTASTAIDALIVTAGRA